jgi:hypothetical protein
MSDRIGDPTREKWSAFMAKCLETGVLDIDEFTERMEEVQQARTMDDIRYRDLPWEAWSKAWDRLREKGLKPKAEILPDVPRKPGVHVLNVLIVVSAVFAVAGWFLFFMKGGF